MALDDFVRQLKQIDLFQSLAPEALRLIAFAAETRILQPGDVLFRQGEPADSGILLLRGSLVLTQDDNPDTSHAVPAGALVGETALLMETARTATAVAAEVSGVLAISRPLFLRALREFPDSAVALRNQLAQRTTAMTSALEDFRARHLSG
jgi:CRP-like cAMP-binding protein